MTIESAITKRTISRKGKKKVVETIIKNPPKEKTKLEKERKRKRVLTSLSWTTWKE